MRPRLVIMLKEPVAGRVKTRLGQDIGMTTSAWWFRHQSAALIRRLQSPRWETWLAVAPDTALHSRCWPAQLPRMAQGQGDLGARMARILRSSKGPVVLIGGDIPGVEQKHIAEAFRQLGQQELVFGPATDGGFWLVGKHQRVPHGLFENVRWSCPTTLTEAHASAGAARVGKVSTLSDVDTARDLYFTEVSSITPKTRTTN
ncbi:MAG: TIGR04282 family arsenosugar biosynthesis glycosyltransferase [Rhodobacteraceae bacterium]|nr:TIGR04282 family arsenosugar biosynthesis glycosyltransferase [Paracoccaceae bacterium]